MRVQLTAAGQALLEANTGPVTVTSFKIGSAFGYIPEPSDTDIHGTLIYSGVPSSPLAVSGNVVKYSSYLDYDLGPFLFGEIGLFVGSTLFALATGDTQIDKLQLTSVGTGNSIRIDEYVSVVGTNYEMWLDLAESDNEFRAAVLGSPDQLPQPQDATPNLYIISGATSQQSAFFAYTDRAGLWNFDAYAYADQASATIVGFDFQSVTIALSDYVAGMNPAYLGAVIAEFSTGTLYGTCRYVESAVTTGGQVVLGFDNTLAATPVVGDKIIVFGRQALSTTIPNLPIATHSQLGAIIVGTTLTVDGTGLINVDPTAFPVTSVNGQTGAVNLHADEITDIATVAVTGSYTDLINKPAVYSLPVATTSVLGGVKAPSDSNLTIAGDGTIDLGFAPVKSVNSSTPDPSTGNVVITAASLGAFGLVKPTQIPNGGDLNTYNTTGLFFVLAADVGSILNGPGSLTTEAVLEVEPFVATDTAGDVVQTIKTGTQVFIRGLTGSTWSPWVALAVSGTAPVATTTTAGVVIVGAGLNVTGGGLLSTQIQSVNGKTDQFLTLAASDVAAVPISGYDQQGGVPQNSLSPNVPQLATDPYTYNRIAFQRLPLGTWFDAGTWDASANHVNGDTLSSLASTGEQTIDINYGVGAPDYQTVTALGNVYLVSVAGTTSIDGIASWNVGDLAVCNNNVWKKITFGNPFPVAFYAPGPYTASQIINEIPLAVPVSFAAGTTGNYVKAGAVSTAGAVVSIGHRAGLNGAVTAVGTLTFTAGTVIGVASITAAFAAVAGDCLVFTGPGTADPTLGSISASILGSR